MANETGKDSLEKGQAQAAAKVTAADAKHPSHTPHPSHPVPAKKHEAASRVQAILLSIRRGSGLGEFGKIADAEKTAILAALDTDPSFKGQSMDTIRASVRKALG